MVELYLILPVEGLTGRCAVVPAGTSKAPVLALEVSDTVVGVAVVA